MLHIAKKASPTLSLLTFQRNAQGRRFYEKHGFAAILETDGGGNEEREPDVLYCRSHEKPTSSAAGEPPGRTA